MAKTDRTPEEIAERKAAAKERRAAKKQAMKDVIEFVRSRKNVPDEILEATKLFEPGRRTGGGGGGTSILDKIAERFQNQSEVTELEIFQEFKMGRAQMRKLTRNLIKKREPNDRMWVRLDADAEKYVVEGFGPEPPAGWTGYVPVQIEDEEIL